MSGLSLTNSSHGGDLVALYDVQQWSHWLGLLTFNMLQYASFTQVDGGTMREREKGFMFLRQRMSAGK